MMEKIAILIFMLLFSVLVGGARTKLKWAHKYGVNEDGICKSIVQAQGYACEEHTVTTKDGYILNIQRIPTGRSGGGKKEDKPPVLLQHGILSDAMTWLSNSPSQSLGFILADGGFDVWLTNVRGTKYSRGHTSLSPIDLKYWEWSWDELVAYDLPAYFQYVHQQTGQKLHYVGHSLGTLMAFGALSKHEVLDKVRSAALLCPIAYLGQMPSPFIRVAAEIFLAEDIYWLGLKEFAPGGGPAKKLVDDICSKKIIDCNDIMSIFTGPNCCLNTSKSNMDDQEPTSTKNIVHLAQMVRLGNIAMYDYGNEHENKKHYGQPTAPEYNMTSIPNDIPLFFGYGGKDLLADVKDVEMLPDKLIHHNPDKLVKLYIEDYAHLDFVKGLNAREVVYNPLMDFFQIN